MRRRSLLVAAATTGALSVLPKGAKATTQAAQAFPVLDSLAMPVSPEENRQFSFTDKASAYFYGRTHQDKPNDWFFGWNVATKRIFQDFRLTLDGKPLLRAGAKVVVSPHAMTRDYGEVKETLRMFDGLTALMVEVETAELGLIGFEFTGDLLSVGEVGAEGVWYRPKEAPTSWLLLAPIEGGGKGFFIILGASRAGVRRVLSQLRRNHQSLTRARKARMEALVSGSRALDAGDPDRTKALLWMRLTADQLVMKQMGTGIYAGLPWFNDYWGRDTFISITGTLFVTGQYDVAADAFRSFAALQDTDLKSKTYGRIPNRARPDGVQYNTADGTPRFIITLADLVQRSGNNALAKELWPTVKRAIEGVLANNVDEHGVITHDDADTWMDAKEKGVRAFSPRGNRAIDIQALWLEAFSAASDLLGKVATTGRKRITRDEFRKDSGLRALFDFQSTLNDASVKLQDGIYRFEEPTSKYLVDHLRSDGTQDLKLRPNVLFALSPFRNGAVPFPEQVEAHLRQLRSLWEGLVYPWGVATLAQSDPDFHPYHEHWHYYHKDAAYHNGTVWPWLNGIAIQRMLEQNQIEPAWALFENMNRQAMNEGAVGSLAECADALPVDGANWTRRTGTFLQAWSNAEHLRVWHEYFVGLRTPPEWDLSGSRFGIDVRPRLPNHVHDVRSTLHVGRSRLEAHLHAGGAGRWKLNWFGPEDVLSFNAFTDREIEIQIDLPVNGSVNIQIQEQSSTKESAYGFMVEVFDANNKKILGPDFIEDVRWRSDVQQSGGRIATLTEIQALRNEIFAGLDFCKPRLQPNLKSLTIYHDPPLTY